MAVCSDDTLINLVDLEKGNLVRNFIGHSSYVHSCKLNNVSNILVSASADNKVFIWDIRTNKAIFEILAHPEPLTSIDISSDNSLVATSSYDGFVRIWDLVKGNCLRTFIADSGSNQGVSDCRFTPNGKNILMASMDDTVGLYDLNDKLAK